MHSANSMVSESVPLEDDSGASRTPPEGKIAARDEYEQNLWLRELFELLARWNGVRDGTPSKAEAFSALWKHAHNIGPNWRARAAASREPSRPAAWPTGLLERVKAAEQRVQDNRAPRSIPADPNGDVDLVLAEVRYLIEGRWPPFWSAASVPASGEQESEDKRDAERYRWLRQQHWNEAPLCVVAQPRQAVKLGHDCPALQRLDAAIDEAMGTAGAPASDDGQPEPVAWLISQHGRHDTATLSADLAERRKAGGADVTPLWAQVPDGVGGTDAGK